jgi:hypothetical protein
MSLPDSIDDIVLLLLDYLRYADEIDHWCHVDFFWWFLRIADKLEKENWSGFLKFYTPLLCKVLSICLQYRAALKEQFLINDFLIENQDKLDIPEEIKSKFIQISQRS